MHQTCGWRISERIRALCFKMCSSHVQGIFGACLEPLWDVQGVADISDVIGSSHHSLLLNHVVGTHHVT